MMIFIASIKKPFTTGSLPLSSSGQSGDARPVTVPEACMSNLRERFRIFWDFPG
jgi:hypothetical protein